MKNLLKTGKVNIWFVGKDAVIASDLDASMEDLREAMDAEEELNRYRKHAVWN